MQREELLIEADELTSRLDDPNLRLFDATVLLVSRDKSAKEIYLEGHIPGAAFLDHQVISDSSTELMFTLPNETMLSQKIGKFGISSDNDVVIYCSDQIMWATRIWWVLRYAGHQRVRVLNGGLSAWSGQLEQGDRQYEPAHFLCHPKPEMFANVREVQDAMGKAGTCTVNALPYSLYTGEADVAYARQGHITGSVSQPFDELTDGVFMKSNAELKEKFKEFPDGERLITYCGGGIAATLNACAAKVAGIDDVGVYDGSLSEWLSEGLPTTTGKEPGSLS